MKTLENKNLIVHINTDNGTLMSILDKSSNTELLWQADHPKSWNEQDVVIFPAVARMKDAYYTHNGKRYDMPLHGFIMSSKMATVSESDTSITLEQRYNEKTLEMYPFKFLFRIKLTLTDNNLNVIYSVENLDDQTIPFMLGAHPGIAICGEDTESETCIDGNKIVFNKEQRPKLLKLNDTGHYIVGEQDFEPFTEIELTKQLMRDYKTLIFEGIDCDSLSVVRKDGKKVTFDIGNAKYLAFWTQEDYGAYICVEPWHGIPDFDNPEREITKKKGINLLESGQTFKFEYKITV